MIVFDHDRPLPHPAERARAQAGQRIDDQREATGEIIAKPAMEAHSRAVFPGNNPKAIVLDLVRPLAVGR
jgi:hypothetical protein